MAAVIIQRLDIRRYNPEERTTGFAVYRDGMVVAQFIPILLGCRMDLIDYQRLMSFCPVK